MLYIVFSYYVKNNIKTTYYENESIHHSLFVYPFSHNLVHG